MEFKNGTIVIEKVDIEPLSQLLFDSLLNDMYLLREVQLTDFSKNNINQHINRCISMLQMLFSSLRVE